MITIISSLFGLIIILLSIIGYGNIFNKNRRDNDLFFTIIIGISCSVIVYYLNYFSYLFGINETLPVLLSVWLPHLVLSLFCIIGILGLNEN